MVRHLDRFLDLCREKFQFLVDEFGCRVVRAERDKRYGGEVIYQNGTSAVGIYYDAYEGVVTVKLARLVDGMPPPYGDLRNGYPSWALVRLRAPAVAAVRGSRRVQTEEDLEAVLAKEAAEVKAYGADILHGDFSSFPELERIRAEEYRGGPPADDEGGASAP